MRFLLLPILASLLSLAAAPRVSALVAPKEVSVGLQYLPSTANYQVSLSFLDANFDESNYLVQLKKASASAWTNLGYAGALNNSSGMPETFFLSFPLSLTVDTYQFRIAATKGSSVLFSASAQVGMADFGAPTLLNCVALGPFSVSLQWQENSVKETGYRINFREVKTPAEAWQTYGTTNTFNQLGPLTLTSSAFQPGGTYEFQILGEQQAAGTPKPPAVLSVASNTKSVTLPTMPAPTNFRVTGRNRTSVTLAWKDNCLYETGTAVQSKLRGTGDDQWELTWRVDYPDATTATISSIDPGLEYDFRVVQFINYQSSGILIGTWSATIQGSYLDVIKTPPGLAGVPGQAFSHTFATTNFVGTISSTTVTGLPAWMSYDATSRTLTGTPPGVGVQSVDFSAVMTTGQTLTQRFYVRTRIPKAPPEALSLVGNQTISVGADAVIDLTGHYRDPETTQALRMSISNFPNGNSQTRALDLILYPDVTPATVTNFMAYVNSGKFADSIFHRAPAGFVVQGGGFRFASDAAGQNQNPVWTRIATDSPVTNEPGLPNIPGTLAMAKLGNDPNSATNQFFANINNNSREFAPFPNGLDFQNGGFTVFGRVADKDISLMTAINSLPKVTINATVEGSSASFGDVPFAGSSTTIPVPVPDVMTVNDHVRILSITPLTTFLHYEVIRSSNPTVATASIANNQLTIHAVSPGDTTVTIQAVDVDGQTTVENIGVNVPSAALQPGYALWQGNNGLNAINGVPTQDADHDGLNNLLEYAFGKNPLEDQAAPVSVTQGTDGRLWITFPARISASDIVVSVEGTNHVGTANWQEIWNSAQGTNNPSVVNAEPAGETSLLTVRDSQPISGQAHRYLRVKVTLR